MKAFDTSTSYLNPGSSHQQSLPPRRNPDETATTAGCDGEYFDLED